MRNTKEAFNWIVDILRKNQIRFKVDGGLAAKVYGSDRKLADIDIVVHDKDVNKVASLILKYIIYGPKHFIGERFDCYLFTAKYKGQDIDISGGDSERIFYKRERKWIKSKDNFSKFSKKKIFDKIVHVIPEQELINYKSKLNRRVDKIDVKKMLKRYKK